MRIAVPSALLPPQSTSYEQTQRARLLHIMLLALLIGSLYFALQNIGWGDIPSAISLFLLAAISVVTLWLSHRCHFRLAASLFAAMALGVLDYVLMQDGAGLYDPGVVVYPIFILCAAFLFGRQGFLLSIFLCIASIVLLYWLEANERFTPIFPSTPSHAASLSVLFIIAALIIWIVVQTWENHLVQLQESYDLTLRGWAKALEYRDEAIEGHSRRVTELAVALAQELGLRDEELLNIRRGAYLHDIGKMAIPDRILFKDGPLDEAEWAIMKRHPTFAREMLSGIPFLRPALDIPYSHHENWDGTGYPQGLKGQEIPLAARIFAVVDRWDALGSDRPYHKAWTREQIISHFRENAGKTYDSRVVDALLILVYENRTL